MPKVMKDCGSPARRDCMQIFSTLAQGCIAVARSDNKSLSPESRWRIVQIVGGAAILAIESNVSVALRGLPRVFASVISRSEEGKRLR